MMSYNAIRATATLLSYTQYLVTLQKNWVTEESSSFYEEELAASQIRKFVLLTHDLCRDGACRCSGSEWELNKWRELGRDSRGEIFFCC